MSSRFSEAHAAPPAVLVLGVGNILFTDEGLGVRAVEHLQRHARLPGHIRLLDGGTLGMRLMPAILECDVLLVLDAVLGHSPPGSLYRLEGAHLRDSLSFKDSMHQTDLLDVLTLCEITGHRPDTVVLGMQPDDVRTLHHGLTPAVDARIPALAEAALHELRARNLIDPA